MFDADVYPGFLSRWRAGHSRPALAPGTGLTQQNRKCGWEPPLTPGWWHPRATSILTKNRQDTIPLTRPRSSDFRITATGRNPDGFHRGSSVLYAADSGWIL